MLPSSLCSCPSTGRVGVQLWHHSKQVDMQTRGCLTDLPSCRPAGAAGLWPGQPCMPQGSQPAHHAARGRPSRDPVWAGRVARRSVVHVLPIEGECALVHMCLAHQCGPSIQCSLHGQATLPMLPSGCRCEEVCYVKAASLGPASTVHPAHGQHTKLRHSSSIAHCWFLGGLTHCATSTAYVLNSLLLACQPTKAGRGLLVIKALQSEHK